MSKILNLLREGNVFGINLETLGQELMTKEEMEAIFDYFDAFWEYNGKPNSKKPHALLKSGKHSNGFIACKNVLTYVQMCELFAGEIVKNFNLFFPVQWST